MDPEMFKPSFRHNVLLLLIVCLCVSQVSTMLATLATTEHSVRLAVREELDAARSQFNQLFLARYSELRRVGQELGADRDFLAAAANAPALLQTLLENTIIRSMATHALYVAPDGEVQASAGPTDLSVLATTLHTGAFVRELEQDGQDAIIVRSTIDMAHSMGLEVVAEGVESARALALLREMDCDQGQGYLFCKPVDALTFEDWFRNQQAVANAA